MKILVDADSCPAGARRVILKAAEKRRIKAVFAANRPIPDIKGDFVVMALCSPKSGAADDYIVELAEAGDLAITRDVPLALRLTEKTVAVIDDRGRVFTRDNIRSYLSIRNFQVDLAMNGVDIVRTANYGKKELKQFADSFDKQLTKAARQPASPPAGLKALRAGVPEAAPTPRFRV
ncbi:MAG: DUF188 domain-containing protein [Spirochaetaceae bacterium]|jgi:uncharacterized protein YaiI (UPF0178 family)|nr:DUF188 domain-containing protein [Spirochaetaceae bacterium]